MNMEKPLSFAVSAYLDKSMHESFIRRALARMRVHKATSMIFKPRTTFQRLKGFFQYREAKNLMTFWNSFAFAYALRLFQALTEWLEPRSYFPRWVLRKIVEEKFRLLGRMLAIIVAAGMLGEIVRNSLSAAELQLGISLLAASAAMIFLGNWMEKHGEKSFFLRKAADFWNETRI